VPTVGGSAGSLEDGGSLAGSEAVLVSSPLQPARAVMATAVAAALSRIFMVI
jgi:hypothetical protein